jgi:hypothetical protein
MCCVFLIASPDYPKTNTLDLRSSVNNNDQDATYKKEIDNQQVQQDGQGHKKDGKQLQGAGGQVGEEQGKMNVA